MKKIVFVLLLSLGALGSRAQVVQSAVTSVVEEKVILSTKYRGWVEGGIGADITDAMLTYEVSTTHGVLLSSGFFAGVGVGFFGHEKQTALPLYLDARQFFGRRRDRGFFVGARLGYNCSLKKNFYEYTDCWWNPYDENWACEKSSGAFKMKGLFFSPGAGVTWKMVNLSVDYLLHRELQQSKAETKGGYPRYKSGLMLRLGVNF